MKVTGEGQSGATRLKKDRGTGEKGMSGPANGQGPWSKGNTADM